MTQPRASILGGSWINDRNAGSRYANVDYWDDNSNENLGARGRSDDLTTQIRTGSRPLRSITAASRLIRRMPNGDLARNQTLGWSAHLSCFGKHVSGSGRAGRSGGTRRDPRPALLTSPEALA